MEDPTGVPRSQTPCVSSTRMLVREAGKILLMENSAIVDSISPARPESASARSLMMEDLLVDVRIGVLDAFKLRRKGLASSQNL